MTADARRAALDTFERGETRVICNVGVLTEGWDCTAVDCMLMCRPTMSPALYVQMIGAAFVPIRARKTALYWICPATAVVTETRIIPLWIFPREAGAGRRQTG